MNKLVLLTYLEREREGGDANFNAHDDPLGIEAKSQEKLFVDKTECSVCTPQASKKITYFFTGQEEEVEGTLSIQPQSNPVKGFSEYFLNLNVENNRRNPWFAGEGLFFSLCYTAAKTCLK